MQYHYDIIQHVNADPNVKLWSAVLELAYQDAIGNHRALYYGGKYCTKSKKGEKDKIIMDLKKKTTRDALRFLVENDWIYTITGVNKEYLFRKIEENKKPRSEHGA